MSKKVKHFFHKFHGCLQFYPCVLPSLWQVYSKEEDYFIYMYENMWY